VCSCSSILIKLFGFLYVVCTFPALSLCCAECDKCYSSVRPSVCHTGWLCSDSLTYQMVVFFAFPLLVLLCFSLSAVTFLANSLPCPSVPSSLLAVLSTLSFCTYKAREILATLLFTNYSTTKCHYIGPPLDWCYTCNFVVPI